FVITLTPKPLIYLYILYIFHFDISLYILVTLPFFFFNDTATTEIYTLSLHDALPILVSAVGIAFIFASIISIGKKETTTFYWCLDRKSTRLNSSHVSISYAVFCLKKKK